MNEIDYHQSEFLADIPTSDTSRIMNRGKHIFLRSGEILFHQGDPSITTFLVLTGRIKLIKLHEEGKETILRYIAPGELTAIVSVFEEKDYPATAEAIGDVDVVGWDKHTMESLMLEHPRLSLNILRCVIHRLDEIQNRFMEICAEQVEQRVARALLRLMKQSGRKEADGIRIDFPLTRQEMANYTGTTSC